MSIRREIGVKKFLVFALAVLFVAVSHAQFPETPRPGASDAEKLQIWTANLTLQHQQELARAAAMQVAMMASMRARQMYVRAALVQKTTMASRLATQSAEMRLAQRTLDAQQRLDVESAILRTRSRGVENAAAMQEAVQMASLDSERVLHQAGGQTATGQAATPPLSADGVPLPVEPPPMMIRPTFGYSLGVEKPKFSVEPGVVYAGTKVRIKSETHYVTLYYTTNGWTPTTQSTKYTGPITINANTHLQVIAVGPNFVRSTVERIDYEVPKSPTPVVESTVAVPADGTLRAGTPLRVVFAGKDIDSETAAVGDEITVVLDEEIKLGDKVLAPKGAPVTAALTVADAGHGPAPGDLVFEIRSVEVAGKHVPLLGGETLEGIKGGKNATIKAGMTAMAFVTADTLVK